MRSQESRLKVAAHPGKGWRKSRGSSSRGSSREGLAAAYPGRGSLAVAVEAERGDEQGAGEQAGQGGEQTGGHGGGHRNGRAAI